MAYSRSGNGSSGVSPFIKPDRLRRNFLRARRSRGATPKTTIKKDDPEIQEARERMMLHQGNSTMENGKIKVKEEAPEEFNEFPLRAVAKEELDNMRTHLLKFQSKKGINPTQDFHLPIRLHRKDTRNLQFQLTRAEIVQRQKEITDYKKKQESERTGNKRNNDNVAQNQTGEAVENHVDKRSPGSPPAGTQAGTEASPEDPSGAESPQGQGPSAGENPSKPTEGMPVVTKLEEAGPAADPTKVGMVKYDGEEALDEQDDLATMDPLADVAPDGGGRAKRGNTRRKTRQLKVLDENAKKLRFEEFYPWVMEDFDGYNTWVGSYEAGNSDSYVLLSVEDDGSFTMIPADKVYKFTARNKYATLTIEEAEKRMDKKSGEVPRWLMKHLDNIGTTTTRYDRTKRRLKAVNDQHGNDDGEHSDNSEVELDYDEEFADDEEAPIIDGDEKENKESEQRIKKEMLQANAMGLRDENAPNEDEEDDLFNEKKIDEEGERIKRALQKTELAALYSSDDEEINPYLSESDVENKEQSEQGNKENSEESPSSKKGSPKKNVGSSSSLNAHREPQIKVKSIKDCVIVLKADKKVLTNFPGGDWNPELSKRKREDGTADAAENTPSKKVKLEENATPLIAEQDIIDAIGDGKVNVKDFGKTIRRKYPGPDNKKLMVAIVKKLCRKVDDEHMELKK
ncbi:hypothetical protein ZYGR_0H02890 [Zygosaccharomyces rouxii]|uniref:Transcription initiation factor IIF subunit alpha n=2 Tax=Zygosaccharomyces rouxii TaxID=4956 RepID=C5DRR7_ZYGRC|nr:uncharacterized protein ZYRO0B10626g [Zygosaccharomyces rouxii]KAH9199987.1 hypothetical protein LQ764DRAFT_111479 [Zygosaccharomyces rouxii]GAV47447.1 hypothetical protein ZYGR_0H02890 [Zygosaccharomyces rouxii]CAR26478.1 ZYRO0B10626p [Zygosaccharomyces rouxii]